MDRGDDDLKARGSRSDRALSIVFRGSWSIPSEHLGEARQLDHERRCTRPNEILNGKIIF